MGLTFEYLPEPEIVIARAPEGTPLQTLTLASVALSKLAHAFDYGHKGERAQIPERWALVTYGVVAALEDPADHGVIVPDRPCAPPRRFASRPSRGVVDIHVSFEASPTVEALRAELVRGPGNAN